MSCLSLPLPVALFFRRLFNVVSSLTISNQYFLVQRADVEKGREEIVRREGLGTIWKELEKAPLGALQTTTVNRRCADADTFLYSHLGRLKAWSSRCLEQTRSISLENESTRESRDNNSGLEGSSPSEPPPSPQQPSKQLNSPPVQDEPLSPIQNLLLSPVLFDPLRKPRFPIVLCHGLYGFDVRGPSSFPMFQTHYWANVMKVLKTKIGAEVIVTGVPSTGSIESRAERMDKFLREKANGREINFVAHSMGGLDCRHLITHVKPEKYTPLSLTTLCTPHRGSPFMDWCTDNIGIGKLRHKTASSKQSEKAELPDPPPMSSGTQFTLASLPSSFTTLLLSILDSPAYSNLTTHYLENVFNPATPNDPRVRYYSIAARTESMSVWHPLWLPKMVLDGVEEKERAEYTSSDGRRQQLAPPLAPWEKNDWGNDGLVSVRSAKWGKFLGTIDGCDHWNIRGSRGLGVDFEAWKNVDISLPGAVKNSLSDPLSNLSSVARSFGSGGAGEGWSWRDWGRFVGEWRKEEEKRDEQDRRDRRDSRKGRDARSSREESDFVLKASTENLSTVFDWIIDQVPYSSSSPGPHSSKSGRAEERKGGNSKDPRVKFDLERFYVALTKKLYDDGL